MKMFASFVFFACLATASFVDFSATAVAQPQHIHALPPTCNPNNPKCNLDNGCDGKPCKFL